MYTVPVIPPDLRHEETIIQAANALNCLQSTITNIFDRIDKRISKNNDKINDLSSRVDIASKKIQNLSGTNKAIKIFSPAKFPSSHVFRDIELTFNGEEAADLTSNILNDHEITSRVDIGPGNIQEKLVFFHFRSAKNKSTAAGVSSHRGLGDIPTYCKSINSVLLFSTAENVYGARKVADDMSRHLRNRPKGAKKAEVGTSRSLIIEPAPISLSNRQKGADKRQQGLFYTPTMNKAPTIDLPADLPDLPGIAGDIQFDYAETNQIAPSLLFETFLDMPKVPGIVEKNEANKETSSEFKAAEPTKTVITSTSPIPPPPPPPPAAMPEPEAVKSVVPPPPPPAPPMNVHPTDQSKQTLPSPKAAPEVDIRSNLMDAIRKAGGAQGGRLRAAADVARQTSTEQLNTVPDKPKVVSGGDLMADLHNKLLMRRKGISGAKDGRGNPTDGGGVMSRLSSLIPPPPVKSQNSSSDDEDAGDDTDWAD
ncbi:WASH complex subunit 1 [Eupeodes corollae]|uniref:WASH complex subunit 1 n=1 Tax=Eupeodes corollae TaxID=290404 RepID=UPI0024924FE5|nr:WASH complex subunit 1 [Eupeodes corollae]XP_055906608.1 WASH complex subunit 1 [Eupeodes corollae]